jgi:hypothetical protein
MASTLVPRGGEAEMKKLTLVTLEKRVAPRYVPF